MLWAIHRSGLRMITKVSSHRSPTSYEYANREMVSCVFRFLLRISAIAYSLFGPSAGPPGEHSEPLGGFDKRAGVRRPLGRIWAAGQTCSRVLELLVIPAGGCFPLAENQPAGWRTEHLYAQQQATQAAIQLQVAGTIEQ